MVDLLYYYLCEDKLYYYYYYTCNDGSAYEFYISGKQKII